MTGRAAATPAAPIVQAARSRSSLARERRGDYTGAMMETMVEIHQIEQTRRRGAIQHIALVLALVIVALQVFTALPLGAVMPDVASSMAPIGELMSAGSPCDGSCPSTITYLCVPGRMCTAVQAALMRVPLTLLMLLVLLALIAAVIRPLLLVLRHEHWLWPPARRRAFLQVFLI